MDVPCNEPFASTVLQLLVRDGDSRGLGCGGAEYKVGVEEAVAINYLSKLHREWCGKHGTGIDAGVELAAFTARIRAWGQIGEQFSREIASHERGG
jgi:hypothetical protein